MLDLLTSAMDAAAFAWRALSLTGLGLAAGGTAILIVALFGIVALPSWASRPAIALGAGLLVAGLLWQAGYAQATHDGQMLVVKQAAVAAERRAAAAERAREADRAQAAVDAAHLEALRKEIDATPRDPAACLPAAAAERLRRFR